MIALSGDYTDNETQSGPGNAGSGLSLRFHFDAEARDNVVVSGELDIGADQSGNGRIVTAASAALRPNFLQSDPNFGNNASIDFDGSARLRRTTTPGDWTFLHDGSGGIIWAVIRPTASLLGSLVSTRGLLGPGLALIIDGILGLVTIQVVNNLAVQILGLSLPSSTIALNQTIVIGATYSESRPGNDSALIVGETEVAAGNSTGLATGTPEGLTLGARSDGTTPYGGALAELAIWQGLDTPAFWGELYAYAERRYDL